MLQSQEREDGWSTGDNNRRVNTRPGVCVFFRGCVLHVRLLLRHTQMHGERLHLMAYIESALVLTTTAPRPVAGCPCSLGRFANSTWEALSRQGGATAAACAATRRAELGQAIAASGNIGNGRRVDVWDGDGAAVPNDPQQDSIGSIQKRMTAAALRRRRRQAISRRPKRQHEVMRFTKVPHCKLEKRGKRSTQTSTDQTS